MDALRAFINELFLRNFLYQFYRKYKKLLKKSVTFLFSHKKFLNIFPKPIPLRHLLTTVKKKKKTSINFSLYICAHITILNDNQNKRLVLPIAKPCAVSNFFQWCDQLGGSPASRRRSMAEQHYLMTINNQDNALECVCPNTSDIL